MELNKAKIVKIYEVKYKFKNVVKSNKKSFIVSSVIFAMLFAATMLISFAPSESVKSYINTANALNNPISSLYNDSSNILFAGKFSEILNSKNLKLISPVKFSEYTISNGEANFQIVNSIMIISPEKGIISNIGVTNSNEKFIEITHNAEIKTRIVNVNICGCVINQMVPKGKEIATAKPNSVVKFSVLISGTPLNTFEINNNEIVWES